MLTFGDNSALQYCTGNFRCSRALATVLRTLGSTENCWEVNHEGETHPRKPPTQVKAQFAQMISEQFVQIVRPFPLKISRKQPETICTNCLCKLFFVSVGCLALNETESSAGSGHRFPQQPLQASSQKTPDCRRCPLGTALSLAVAREQPVIFDFKRLHPQPPFLEA